MNGLPLRFDEAVTLVGGGALDHATVEAARRIAPVLIAADGGADRLAEMRLTPRAVIGDMDSIVEPDRWRGGPAAFVHLAEQDSTDFEKCLYATEAPLYLAVGFTGRRVDHTLAVFHTLLRYRDKPVVVIGEQEVSALAPAGVTLRLSVNPGARVSIYPLLPVTAARSRGLVWPLDGLSLVAGQRIGTSNTASQPVVEVEFENFGALLMLERDSLASLAAAIGSAGISSPAR